MGFLYCLAHNISPSGKYILKDVDSVDSSGDTVTCCVIIFIQYKYKYELNITFARLLEKYYDEC